MTARWTWALAGLVLAACDDGGAAGSDSGGMTPPPADGATGTDVPGGGMMDGAGVINPGADGGALVACGAQARTEDPSGDYVLLGNDPGGRFTFSVDVRLRAVGVLARGPVDVTFTGAFAGMLQRVLVVGPSAGSAMVRGVDASVVMRAVSPRVINEELGANATMSCVTTCDGDGGAAAPGCNTPGQFFEWFSSRLNKGLRWWHVQRASFDGALFEASRGGCCLP
jgi:hypothetical protein